MSRTTNNKIIDTLGILSEGYKSIHLTDDTIREIVDYNQYFHVFENVEDFKEPGKTVYKLSDLLLIIFNTKDEELICEAIESRWMIENDFHREKDRIFGEDYFTDTDTGANKIITLLNNLGLQFIKMYQTITNRELRKSKDYFRVYPVKGISTVLSVMSSEEIVNNLIKQLDKQRKAN